MEIPAGAVTLEGNLEVPDGASGLVFFAHGSGSSPFSPRNRFVARELLDGGLATLLIVGGRDEPVIEMNRDAQQSMECPNELEIVEGATHLFEEPGKLEEVAELARHWFQEHLS